MRFALPTVLGLGLASAAAVPRSALGSWTVTYTLQSFSNGYSSEEATAVFTSASYPDGIKKTCLKEDNPADNPPQSLTCDEGFSFEYEGSRLDTGTITLQQVVQEPAPNTTVYGQAAITLKSDATGKRFSGNATVEVSESTA